MLTDPAFWLAVLAWLIVLLFALGLCVAAAQGDRAAHRNGPGERERNEALNKISGGGGWRKS